MEIAVTDYTELKRLLAEQVYLDEISSRTETIEDEHAFMDADDALDIFLTESQITLESIALALITEREQLKAEVETLRKDTARLDRLDMECEGYGTDIHEGNRWVVDGPFATVRDAIDAALTNS